MDGVYQLALFVSENTCRGRCRLFAAPRLLLSSSLLLELLLLLRLSLLLLLLLLLVLLLFLPSVPGACGRSADRLSLIVC